MSWNLHILTTTLLYGTGIHTAIRFNYSYMELCESDIHNNSTRKYTDSFGSLENKVDIYFKNIFANSESNCIVSR